MGRLIKKIPALKGHVCSFTGKSNNAKQREEAIKLLNHGHAKVLLMTTAVGAFGVELPGANHVVFFQPSWNATTENQAVARAHR